MVFRNKDGSLIRKSPVDSWLATLDGRIRLEETIPTIEDIIEMIKTNKDDETLGRILRENFKSYFDKQK